jgi:hypothetical protein
MTEKRNQDPAPNRSYNSSMNFEGRTAPKYGPLFILLFTLFCIGTGSFVWFYQYPLNTDIPMHAAVAKAFLELIGNTKGSYYPYILNLKFSTYALPEIILAIFIKLLGFNVGTKAALTIYAIAFPLSVAYMVSCINPESTWTRLIGFPLTLNYFFHWGFWTFLIGLIMAVLSMAFAIRFPSGKKGLILNSVARFFTLLMHPAPLVGLIFFDFIAVLMDVRNNKRWFNPLKWNWKRMITIWIIPALSVILMLHFVNYSGGNALIKWGSIRSQAIQVIRPLFVTSHLWEFMVQLLLAGIITLVVFIRTKNSRKDMGIIIGALFLIVGGAILPRDRFLGNSWEIGARIIFMGWILLLSTWAIAESKLKNWIIIWVVFAFSVNLAVSHIEWNKHESSFRNALDALGDDSGKIETRFIVPPDSPSISLGFHLGPWAWGEGKAYDAYNAVADLNDFGPTRYIGVNESALQIECKGKNYAIIYHAYADLDLKKYPSSGRLVYNDRIYTIFEH